MALTVVYLTATGAGTWTVPADWNSASNTIECIGGGGGAAAGQGGVSGGRLGGGGGAYSAISNVALTPGAVVSLNVGVGGTGGSTSGANGTDGGDTWFGAASFASALVAAKGGGASTASGATNSGGVGGAAASGIGSTKFSGGSAGVKWPGGNGGDGGSGAGGPNGNGATGGAGTGTGGGGGGGSGGGSTGGNGSGATGGTGGNNYGGTGGGAANGGTGTAGGGGGGSTAGGNAGGAGGNGTEWDATHGAGGGGGGGSSNGSTARAGGNGGQYGGGGGGGANHSSAWSAGGNGGHGIIVITYDAITGVTVGLTGVAASPAAGSLAIRTALNVTPTGAAAAPAAGSLIARGGAGAVPAGVAASPAAGTVTGKGGARAAPAGVAASPAAGTLSVTLRIIVAPTGVAANPAAGNLAARGGARAAPAGVAASPAAGAPVATGGALLTLEGVAANPAAGRITVEGAFLTDLLRNPAMAGQYLIEVSVYQAIGTSGGIAAVSEIPVGALPGGSSAGGGQIVLRYADRDWIGNPSDMLQANVQYDGRVELPLHAERLAPLYPDEPRRVQRQFGAIEFINSDGALDSIVHNFSVGGRPVRVLFGPYMGPYTDFALIASMVGVGWQPGEDAVRLELRDLSNILSQPLQANLYAGTGGAEGGADIAGKPKPLFFGTCDNATPTLVDPLHLIYQAHDGPMEGIYAVYDRGGLLTLDTSVGTGGDVADYGALVAATVGASKFVTCLADGLFKLGSSPAGLVTASGRGDKTDGVYSDALDVIARRIMVTRGGVDAASINDASFSELAAFSGSVGLYVSSSETPSGADLVDRLTGSVGGWWGSTRNGRIEAGRIKAPETAEVDHYIDEYDILSIQPEPEPIVRWRHRVSWGRNWTVQTGDLDVTVSDARRQFLRSADRVATASDGGLLTSHVSAVDAPLVETLLVNEADASAVAEYFQGLFSVPRAIYRVTLKRLGYMMVLGHVLHITYPRFGMTSGKKFTVIGIAEDANAEEIELRVWG